MFCVLCFVFSVGCFVFCVGYFVFGVGYLVLGGFVCVGNYRWHSFALKIFGFSN